MCFIILIFAGQKNRRFILESNFGNASDWHFLIDLSMKAPGVIRKLLSAANQM